MSKNKKLEKDIKLMIKYGIEFESDHPEDFTDHDIVLSYYHAKGCIIDDSTITDLVNSINANKMPEMGNVLKAVKKVRKENPEYRKAKKPKPVESMTCEEIFNVKRDISWINTCITHGKGDG